MEADICERNASFPAAALTEFAQSRTDDIGHMIKHITGPLQQKRGVEALRRIVIDTELRIASGLLKNPHEVEVTLNTSGRVRPGFLVYLQQIQLTDFSAVLSRRKFGNDFTISLPINVTKPCGLQTQTGTQIGVMSIISSIWTE